MYLRSWALERWAEGTQVDLARDLPRLKREIRAARIADQILKEDGKAEEEVARTVLGQIQENDTIISRLR